MVLDDRGTGASGGKWDSWGERTQQDYKEVLDWIQAQAWSNGSVATTGGSYMGITSLLIAEADARACRDGKPRAVKAVWADVPMADAYRDVTFHGGAIDAGFIPLWLGLDERPVEPAAVDHHDDPQAGADLGRPPARQRARLRRPEDASAQRSASDSAYDGPFYRLRSPVDARRSRSRVPVVIQGGWWDIFQRGEPLLYEKLDNSPDKKLFMSPHYHGRPAARQLEDPELKQKWFDHWLKGADNGVENTPTVNLYTMGGDHWEHHPRWPLPDATLHARAYLDDGEVAAAFADSSASERRRRHRAAAARLEPVLADDRAVDRGRRQGRCARPTTAPSRRRRSPTRRRRSSATPRSPA